MAFELTPEFVIEGIRSVRRPPYKRRMSQVRSSARQKRFKKGPGWNLPTDEKVRVAAEALIALVDAHLPQRFYRERNWRPYCATMVVRMVDTVESLLSLMDADKPVDGAILLRALYEEVVGFLWIAADPDERLDRWVENARYWERKLHTEAVQYDMKLLNRSELARTRDARQMPDLAARAAQVDKYWGNRLVGFRPSMGGAEGILTIKGLYVSIYRFTSRAAHAQPDALDPYLDVSRYPRTVDRPAPTESSIFWPLIVPIFAHALLVCDDQLGWPDRQRVVAANDAMYVRDGLSRTRPVNANPYTDESGLVSRGNPWTDPQNPGASA